MAQNNDLFAIKLIVFSLSFVLIGGIAFFFYALLVKLKQDDIPFSKKESECSLDNFDLSQILDLKQHEQRKIQNIIQNGQEFIVSLLKTNGESEIIIIDYCHNKLIKRIIF